MKKHITILFMILSASMCIVQAKTIHIAIASQSVQKIEAVKAAFTQKFPTDNIIYNSYSTDSSIPEQPVGFESALQGARNRLQNLPENIIADYYVGIENYIAQLPTSNSWYDKGLIIIQHESEEFMIETKATYIPEQYINLAQQMSGTLSELGLSTTIGCAIQQSFTNKKIDPANWHQEIEFGGVSRQQLLQDAITKFLYQKELQFLKSLVLTFPDFPKPGITFANFLPIVQNAQAFQSMIGILAERYQDKNIDAIVGLESRGFILGAALAHQLGVSFIPVRKPGKLPGPIYSINYQKEYGFDTLVIAQDAIENGQRVIIIDDLIATGGSARAAIELVQLTGGIPVEFVSILKVAELEEFATLPIPNFNLID